MDVLKNNFEKIFFFLAMGLLLWSAYSVFTGMRAKTTDFWSKVQSTERMEEANPLPTADRRDYEGRMAALSSKNRHAITEQTPISHLVSGERIVCVSNHQHFIPYDPSIRIVTCQVCGVQRGSVKQDLDDDGMPNEYELLVGLDQNVSNAFEDADGDLYENIVEMSFGTDPNKSESNPGYGDVLLVKDIRRESLPAILHDYMDLGSGKFLLTLQTRAGRFTAKKLGDKIKLTNDDDDLLLLEKFEIKILQEREVVRDEKGVMRTKPEIKRSELTVKRLMNGRQYLLFRGQKNRAVDYTARIRSSIEPNWSASIDSFAQTNFTYRGQSFNVSQWRSSNSINVVDAETKEELLLEGAALTTNLNFYATNIQAMATFHLDEKKTAAEVLQMVRALDWKQEDSRGFGEMNGFDGFNGFPPGMNPNGRQPGGGGPFPGNPNFRSAPPGAFPGPQGQGFRGPQGQGFRGPQGQGFRGQLP